MTPGAAWSAARPYAVIAFADKPACATPEPGWMSQCRHSRCYGHWRTGLDSEAAARQAYDAHRTRCPA